jgi:membrane-associated phospholipid phosphatase
LFLGFAVHSLLVDPLINAWWLRNSPETAFQIGVMNAEVLSLTLGTQQFVANTVGRERPFGSTCTGAADDPGDCADQDRYRSFFSGHTASPFALASATCVHHLTLRLSGDFGGLTCALEFAAAAATGALRIVADKHYATDVLAGAAAGTLIGLAVPLLHYHTGVKPLMAQAGEVRALVSPAVFAGERGPAAGVSVSFFSP